MEPAAIYARISEKDERWDKVGEQVKRMQRVAHERFAVIDIFDADDGVTSWAEIGRARKPRNDYERLVEGVAQGRYRAVLTTSLDRLGRYAADGIAFRELCALNNVLIVTEEGEIDPRVPMDEALAQVRIAFAQMEVANRRLKQIKRFDAQVERGLPLWGVRPFGYEVDRMRPREPEAQAIRDAYARLLDGATLYSIQRQWNQVGLRTTTGHEFTYQSVRRVLLRPHNAGIVVRQDEELPDIEPQWMPLVDRQTFEDVRSRLQDPKRRVAPGRKPTYFAAGLVRCGVCGSVMRSATAASHGEKVSIYRCSVKSEGRGQGERHVAIQTATLDPILRREVAAAFLLGPQTLMAEKPERSEARLELDRELARVRTARQKIFRTIEDSTADDEDVAPSLRRLKAREQAVLKALEQESQEVAEAAMAVDLRRQVFDGHIADFDVAADASKALEARFDGLTVEQQQTLVKQLLDVVVLPGRRPDRVRIAHKVVAGLNAPQ